MPYVPKKAGEILRALKGSVLGRTDLNDINEGSVLSTILSAVASEIASVERRLYTLRESFYFSNAVGSDLDERVRELPNAGVNRILSTNASGTALYLERGANDTNDTLVISAGSTVQSKDGTRYIIPNEVLIQAGDTNIDNVFIIAEIAGSAGNRGIGEINTAGAISDRILTITNTQPLTNGIDTETDTELRDRAKLYLKSLSRSQKAAIEYMARSFISSNGERFTYAELYEDEEKLGYCELNIDDGSGLNELSISKLGRVVNHTVPTGGARTVHHEAPATSEILPANIRILIGGNVNNQVIPSSVNYVSIPERGILYFKEDTLNAGDVVSIQGYRVFVGAIAEIQREIEGDLNAPQRLTGFRAAGTRIVVKPVTPQYIALDISLLVEERVDYSSVEYNVLRAIESFVNSLKPAQILYIAQLIDNVMGITGVKDLRIYNQNTLTFANNIEPSNRKTALRVRSESLQITSTTRD